MYNPMAVVIRRTSCCVRVANANIPWISNGRGPNPPVQGRKGFFGPALTPHAMKVYVVDNGGQWTHREWRVLKYLGVDTAIVPNDTPPEKFRDADGLVLSGGAPRVGVDASKMGRNGEYLDRSDVPILGICAGHQFMAAHFGGAAAPARVPEFGKAQLVVDAPDVLFEGLPQSFEVWESHNDEVSALPPGFVRLAHSENCGVQAMRSAKRPLFGLQFHPEVEHTQHGVDIFRNFLRVCEAAR